MYKKDTLKDKPYPKISRLVFQWAGKITQRGWKGLSDAAGIKERTLRSRIDKPGSYTIAELFQIYKATHFTREDWAEIYDVFKEGDINKIEKEKK